MEMVSKKVIFNFQVSLEVILSLFLLSVYLNWCDFFIFFSLFPAAKTKVLSLLFEARMKFIPAAFMSALDYVISMIFFVHRRSPSYLSSNL